jgi:hypothetical protein
LHCFVVLGIFERWKIAMTIEDKGAKEGKRNSQEKVSWRNPLNESHWPEKNFTACYSYKEICGTLLSEGSYGQLYVSLNKDDVEMAITLFVRSNIRSPKKSIIT